MDYLGERENCEMVMLKRYRDKIVGNIGRATKIYDHKFTVRLVNKIVIFFPRHILATQLEAQIN